MFSESDLLYRLPEKSILSDASGQFAKRIAIVTRCEPEHPENHSFLTKVLAAAQLHLAQDALFMEATPDTPFSFLPLIKAKQAEYILVFGLSPNQLGLGISIPAYQPQVFYGATFLFADKLSELEPDKIRKTKLWQALQHLFLPAP